jgi:DNA-binding beta-propeller fold protein YncE
MKMIIFKRPWQGQRTVMRRSAVAAVWLLAAANLMAMPLVDTLTGGPFQGKKHDYWGYVNGDTAAVAKFNTPIGLAINSSGNYLYVADRDNNAIRYLDLNANLTWTFTTDLISQPVGVAVDNSGDVFVLNCGNGNNGMVLEFASPALGSYLIATNTTGLTNAAGIALDRAGNIYVTVNSNMLICIAAGTTNQTIIASNFPAGTSLKGIVVKHNGLIATCDYGRNGIYLIDPSSGVVTTNAGFHDAGDFTLGGNNIAPSNSAQFFQPYGVAEAGNGTLIVTDYGNNRVKIVTTAGVVTNLYGVNSFYWGNGPGYPQYKWPGWSDGSNGIVVIPDNFGDVEARLPAGVCFSSDGTVYVTEDYYHIIRKVTDTGLPLPPPPPPQVPTPQIGWVAFPPPDYTSVFQSDPSASYVFNNFEPIVIRDTNNCQIFYTYGPTPAMGDIPDPTAFSYSAPVGYVDGLDAGEVFNVWAVFTPASILPKMTVKAIGMKDDGSPNSEIAEAKFQFETANPQIVGNNAGLFSLSDITDSAVFWYSKDGTDPTNAPGTTNFDHSILLCTNSPLHTNVISLSISSNFTFKVRAFRDNFKPSAVISTFFAASNFLPNTISFGFASGEASSDFIASPGQTFYAPVTLSLLPDTTMYSLQFNLTVTNAGPHPGPPITPGAFGFQSSLIKPIPGSDPVVYEVIPPLMFSAYAINPPPVDQIVTYDDMPFVNMVITNTSINLLGVGWLERRGMTNLYDTTVQDLIKYSEPHDTIFLEENGKVVVGGYAFQVPVNAGPGQTYQIQVARPSATSDGIGTPGSSVYIYAPTNNSLGGGELNSIKNVTMGQRKYIVGDVYPFRWFNAGDFGTGDLIASGSADVMQVFQSAIYGLDYPPLGSDFFDAMDSCGATYMDLGHGYLELNTLITATNALNILFNGDDTTINQIAFGDGNLDVCDVYVTYRRSLDPSLTWFRRFWTNGVRVAETTPNVAIGAVALKPALSSVGKLQPATSIGSSITNQPKVNFASTDFLASAKQVISIPITAKIFGDYPLRVLMLNLSVVPLDGSPALTTPVAFSYNPALGLPWKTEQQGNGNYSGVWLNSTNSGLTGNATLGTLTVTIPTNATGLSAYAIHFDHASASPNGIASFPKQTLTGLITLSSRSGSHYNDGIPDSWRLRWFGTIYNTLSVSNADACGDGVNNWKKFIAGTDPTDPKAYLHLYPDTSVSTGTTAAVHWPSVTGKQYVIERSASLFPPNWTPISTNTGTGADMEFNDTTDGNIWFYRVRVQ